MLEIMFRSIYTQRERHRDRQRHTHTHTHNNMIRGLLGMFFIVMKIVTMQTI